MQGKQSVCRILGGSFGSHLKVREGVKLDGEREDWGKEAVQGLHLALMKDAVILIPFLAASLPLSSGKLVQLQGDPLQNGRFTEG